MHRLHAMQLLHPRISLFYLDDVILMMICALSLGSDSLLKTFQTLIASKASGEYHHVSPNWLEFRWSCRFFLWFFMWWRVMTRRDEICRFISLPSWPCLASLQMRVLFHAQSHRRHFWHIFICSTAPSGLILPYWDWFCRNDFPGFFSNSIPEPIGALFLGLQAFNNL